MEKCKHCNELHNSDDMLETGSGELVCNSCADEKCMRCYDGDCEVETRDGDYICSDCYSGDIDNAYDSMRD